MKHSIMMLLSLENELSEEISRFNFDVQKETNECAIAGTKEHQDGLACHGTS